ncbi:MAG: hypothetical protein ACRYFZ_08180 [Janthinobacterium lividum]
MKKLVSLCLLILAAFTSYGQQREVEDFINQAYLAVVPASFRYYNLIDSSCAVAPNRYSLNKDDFTDIVKIYPDFPVSFFLQQAFPSKRIDWKEYHLTKARLYPVATAPSLPVGVVAYRIVPFAIAKARLDSLNRSKKQYEILVPTKKNWSQKRIAKAAQKA